MTEQKIELRPRFRPKDASYDPGGKIRGDKEIWVDGVRWGHVEMKGHGCHGPSYEFFNVYGSGIVLRFKHAKTGEWQESRHGGLERVHPPRMNRREKGDTRTVEDHIIEKARALIAEDRLRHPDILKAENEESRARYVKVREAEEVEREMIRDALKSLFARADLSNAEREGLSLAYKDIFHGPIEKVTA